MKLKQWRILKVSMNEIIRWIKKQFGIYETGYEYWVYTKDIKIKPEYRKHRIGENKFRMKMRYWRNTGEFQSKIVLDRDFNLIDGYSSFRIAEINGIEKVPVYFMNVGCDQK